MAAKGRIEVQCPHCGNVQLEPVLAQSTYCRKCTGYIQIGKAGRTGQPQEAPKPVSVIQKLEGVLGVQRTVVAHCFECAGKREVPKSATSTICPLCGAYIDLQDYKIVGNFSRSIRTRGRVLITPKGDLSSNRVICDFAEIQGFLRGTLICSGEVKIRLKGKLSGAIEAKLVTIERKSEVSFVRPLRADLVDIGGIVSARIISEGKVIVRKDGRLTGAVVARGFEVEGGEFFGELSIGNIEAAQASVPVVGEERTHRQGEQAGSGTDFSLAPA
ncbi:MAG: polymer-forming cytoskeletal protein [Verrucomicrobia bacterium]|nr:polymer-forming cytoskeletal protein [Verrucomicrobiota bacterium]